MKDKKGNILYIKSINYSDDIRIDMNIRVYKLVIKIKGIDKNLYWWCDSKIKQVNLYKKIIVKALKDMDTHTYFKIKDR